MQEFKVYEVGAANNWEISNKAKKALITVPFIYKIKIKSPDLNPIIPETAYFNS